MDDMIHVAQRKRDYLKGKGYRVVGELLEIDQGKRCGLTRNGRVAWFNPAEPDTHAAPAQ